MALGDKYYSEKTIVISSKIVHFIRLGSIFILGILYTWFHTYINIHGGEFGVFDVFLYYPYNLISTFAVSLIYVILIKLLKLSCIKVVKSNRKNISITFALAGVTLLLGYRYLMPLLHNTFSKRVYVYVSYYVLLAIILIVCITVVLISLSMSDWNNLLLIICIGTGLIWAFIGVRLPMLRAEQNPAILNFIKTVSPVIVSCLPILMFNMKDKKKNNT